MPVHFVGEPLLCLLDQLRLPFVADLKDVVDQDSAQCAAPTSGARLGLGLEDYVPAGPGA